MNEQNEIIGIKIRAECQVLAKEREKERNRRYNQR